MDSNTNTSVSTKRRGRPRKYQTEEERVIGNRKNKLMYYRAHKQQSAVFHRQYVEMRKLYIKLLVLIKQNKIPDDMVKLLINNKVVNTESMEAIHV